MLALMLLSLVAGCSLLPPEDEKETLPEIRVPTISQKPEYPVKRTTLELKTTGSGKLLSAREEKLVFETDNRRIMAVHVKAGDEVEPGQLLAELDTGSTDSQLRRKQIEIEKAELDLKEALRGADDAAGAIDLRKRQLEYELLKQELADLQEELRGTKLVAPFSGTITSFTAKRGDMARAYVSIGGIADLDALVVAVQLGTSDLESVAPGMEALVGLNAAGDFKGKVRSLPVSGAAADSLDAYVLIDIEGLPDGIGHGTPLSASVIVERRTDVLTIPLAALRQQNSRTYVLASSADGSKGEIDVEIGVQTTTDVEIIKGLDEGQKVVGR